MKKRYYKNALRNLMRANAAPRWCLIRCRADDDPRSFTARTVEKLRPVFSYRRRFVDILGELYARLDLRGEPGLPGYLDHYLFECSMYADYIEEYNIYTFESPEERAAFNTFAGVLTNIAHSLYNENIIL